jgi:hypothetical protein
MPTPITFTIPSFDSIDFRQMAPSIIAFGLLMIFLISLLLAYRWLQPDPAQVRRFVYELISSRIPNDINREADLRKIIAVCTFLLITFLLIKKQIMATNINAVGNGVTDGNIDSLLLFTATLLGLGVFATKFKDSTGPQLVEVTNNKRNPVPTAEAASDDPDKAK